MQRNTQLSVRQPEATSLSRAKRFNRDDVLHFLHLLESNIATVQKCPHLIVAQKGKHHVGVVASGERGSTPQWCAQPVLQVSTYRL
jgi:hypothetical protein